MAESFAMTTFLHGKGFTPARTTLAVGLCAAALIFGLAGCSDQAPPPPVASATEYSKPNPWSIDPPPREPNAAGDKVVSQVAAADSQSTPENNADDPMADQTVQSDSTGTADPPPSHTNPPPADSAPSNAAPVQTMY